MNLQVHQDILARLEIVKSEGIIADYWVSWVGIGGKLEPTVRTWVTGVDTFRDAQARVLDLLEGLVAEQSITVRQV
jgi:hypothetical protein